jgi:hypothetical protein
MEPPVPTARYDLAVAGGRGGALYVLGGAYSELEGVPYAKQLVHTVDVYVPPRGPNG